MFLIYNNLCLELDEGTVIFASFFSCQVFSHMRIFVCVFFHVCFFYSCLHFLPIPPPHPILQIYLDADSWSVWLAWVWRISILMQVFSLHALQCPHHIANECHVTMQCVSEQKSSHGICCGIWPLYFFATLLKVIKKMFTPTVGRIMALKDVHIFNHGTCEYVALLGKETLWMWLS